MITDPSRRAFLKAGVLTAAGAALAGCCCRPCNCGPAGQPGYPGSGGTCPQVWVRRRLSSWTDQDYETYRKAVTVMQSRPDSDPTSWNFQANIHGAFSSDGSNPAWSQCQHSIEPFLTWHRMYVYWWERIARKACGDPNFAIGYWRYDPADAASLVLPAAFRTPTTGNALFVADRRAVINAGTPVTASAASSAGAMAESVFLPPPSPGFSSAVNGTPHGNIHVQVGGGMGIFERAARDPIFWTHHANIDRLWSRWLDDPAHANPTSSSFLDTPFSFFDEDGTPVTMTGKEVLNTVDQLCYRYDDDPQPAQARTARQSRGEKQKRERIVMQSKLLASGAEPRNQLGGQPQTFKLELDEPARQSLQAALDGGRRIVLNFEDAGVDGTPDTTYEVYVNVPADQPPRGLNANSPHFAGAFSLFGLERKGHEAHRGSGSPPKVSFNITPILARRDRPNLQDVTVTVLPVQPGSVPGAVVPTKAAASFRRLTLTEE